jgi:NAD(P)H-hydrate epimerase
MTAALTAQGIEPVKAACCAVFIHGLAGDLCAEKLSQYGMLPSDMLMEIPQIFRDMSR